MSVSRTISAPGTLLMALVLVLAGSLRALTSQGGEHLTQGFSLVVAVGAVVCLGHLAAHLYRRSSELASACSVLGGFRSLESGPRDAVNVESAGWPVLVSLLFGPFFVLLAGLGGWV